MHICIKFAIHEKYMCRRNTRISKPSADVQIEIPQKFVFGIPTLHVGTCFRREEENQLGITSHKS